MVDKWFSNPRTRKTYILNDEELWDAQKLNDKGYATKDSFIGSVMRPFEDILKIQDYKMKEMRISITNVTGVWSGLNKKFLTTFHGRNPNLDLSAELWKYDC